mgnify:CR=1 FL=1
MDLAACGMIPAHRNFADMQSGAMREIKQLNVKGETIDASGFENWAADVHPKCFETTLRVPKRKTGGEAHEQIENTAGLFSPPRLMMADQAAVDATREPNAMSISPLAIGSITFGVSLQRRRKIGIEEKSDRFLRRQVIPNARRRLCRDLENSRANACSIFAVSKTSRAIGDVALSRSIIHDDQFALGADVREDNPGVRRNVSPMRDASLKAGMTAENAGNTVMKL